jgi:hypothetical protein
MVRQRHAESAPGRQQVGAMVAALSRCFYPSQHRELAGFEGVQKLQAFGGRLNVGGSVGVLQEIPEHGAAVKGRLWG